MCNRQHALLLSQGPPPQCRAHHSRPQSPHAAPQAPHLLLLLLLLCLSCPLPIHPRPQVRTASKTLGLRGPSFLENRVCIQHCCLLLCPCWPLGGC